MCLAIPVRVIEILDNSKVKVDLEGVTLQVSSLLVGQVAVGDYALVHAGFIIEKISEDDAKESLALFAEIREKTYANEKKE
ncbi:MAG: HypC/HybG/HupF family hydrogenase formation chaperone [Oligoflexia bacterium]|nr:HypC/HybG/HupF family hydrogenase formation chaperone [Oligoflexia bacterium]MBF0365347.1 HypC/HybG/HupF family hydrogenase formation chaperone [Oligoflexia bacterium]